MNRLLLAAVAAALVPAGVLASEDDAHRHGMFERWDANGDGVVTRTEVEQGAVEHARRMFDAVDADGDGTLTKSEAEQVRAQKRAAWREKAEERFKAADTDADGRLSKAEVEQGMPRVARRFAELDADKDGALSAEELRAARRDGGERRAR